MITQTSGESDSCRWCGPELFILDGPPTVSAKGDIYSFGMTILEVCTCNILSRVDAGITESLI